MDEPTLRGRLEQDLKQAMRDKDVTGRETIRFTLAALQNAEIEARTALTSGQEMELLQRQTKRRQEAIDQFRAAGRDDLVDRETAQLAVLQRYLPSEIDDEAVEALVRDAIAAAGATGPRDMGKVMPIALAAAGTSVNGKRLSTAVKQALASLG